MKLFFIIFLFSSLQASGLRSRDAEIVEKGWCDEERNGYVSREDQPILLSMNYNKGAYLVFSNDKTYEIAPDDRLYAAYWLTPFPAEFGESGDADYPVKITNLYSDRSVRGKEVSTRETLREEMEPAPAPTEQLPPLTAPIEQPTSPKEPTAK